MTVSSDTSTASYTGNGTTAIFPVPFYFLVDTDVKVTYRTAATGVIRTLVLNSDYTLTGAGSTSGGSLTTIPAVPAGDQIFIERAVDAVQNTAYPVNSPFPAASHEKALDRLTMIAQQILGALGFKLGRDPLGATYDAGGNTISNAADGAGPTDLATVQQVDTKVAAAAGGVLPADIALYSGLASTAAGKGASLIGYLTGTVKSFLDSLSATGSAIGSALIGFLQAGTGAVSRTAQDKMREARISVKDFGAVGDGVADDTAAFNAAVTYCASRNGGVIFVPAGTYLISSMITVSTNNIVFQGEGFDTQHDSGQPVHPTLLQWRGGTDDAMLLFTSIAGVSNKCLTGCGVLDLALSGYNSVGGTRPLSNVELRSHRGGKFRFYGTGGGAWILKLGVVSQLGEAEDTQYNTFSVWGRQLTTPGGGIYLGGNGNNPPNANTSFNRFELVDLQIDAGTGISFGNSDTNIMEVVRVTGVTTGKAYEFLGSNLNTSDTARGNFVRLLSSTGPGYARGTTTYTYPSVANYIGLDIGNGTPIPTVETGATCYYSAEAGAVQIFPSGARMNLSDNLTSALNDRPNVTNESLRILNSSQNHVRLTDGTNVWGVYIAGGNLRFKLLAGSGTIGFGVFSSSADAAVNGYVTIQDANGNVRKLATIA